VSPRLAAVFAHPDDDTFGLGGSVALHMEKGLELFVVVATKGEAGMIADPSLATRENLGKVREEEERRSLDALGAKDAGLRFYDYPDGALAEAPRDELVQKVEEDLAAFVPDVVVTFGPEGVTKHDDHIAIHQATTEAFHRAKDRADGGFLRLLYVAIPQTEIERFQEMQRMAGMEPFNPEDPFAPRGVPDQTIAIRVDCTNVVPKKVEALRAHRTQAEEMESIPEEAHELVFGQEAFVQAWPPREPGDRVLSDLFEGL
jgi:LmbE family N-acetylglucosaminyl deacetylase